MTDTEAMHHRRLRVRLETERHVIEGTLQLPNEGYRSRMTDFLNAHEQDFLPLIDVRLRRLDGQGEDEEREYVAVSARHIVLVTELESLGVVDETGGEPGDRLSLVSTPPPPPAS
jgi:hypothetical protein